MTTFKEAHMHIGQHIKSDHPYAYRYGQWATIIGAQQLSDRIIWDVRWPDGITDEWVVDDATAGYTFRDPFQCADIAVRALEALGEITLAVLRDEEAAGIRAPRELRDEINRIIARWDARENA